ncbi:MAG: hypothetical protein AAGE59_23630 [Cyanobacteria bacterium P01_F01_bin.86]
MAALQHPWQAKRKVHHQHQQQFVRADSWRYQQVCPVSVRRATAKLPEFEAELQEAVAARCNDIQLELQEIQPYVAKLQTFVSATPAQRPPQPMVRLNHSAWTPDEGTDNPESPVADYLNGISESRRTLDVQSQHQGHRQGTHSESPSSQHESVVAPKQKKQSFPRNLQEVVRSDVPEWKGNRAPSPSFENDRPTAKVQPVPQTLQSSSQPSPNRSAASVAEAKTPEQAVYRYLQSHNKGARLPEIESSLKISRLEVVDALRLLIRKDLIIQDMKTYHVSKGAAK